MLIIPKKHILDLDDMDMDTLNHIMLAAKKMKKTVIRTLETAAFRTTKEI